MPPAAHLAPCGVATTAWSEVAQVPVRRRTPTAASRRDPRFVREAYEIFLEGGTLAEGLDPTVRQSWLRSAHGGVDPEQPHVALLDEGEFRSYRHHHPLTTAMPLVRDLLAGASDDGLIIAVSDEVGRLLWVEGSAGTRRQAERVGFVEGALWGEAQMGTNAPGTALATRLPVQVLGAEHFTRPVQRLNCAAAPVRDLATGRTVGVLDVTGGDPAGSPVALALVRATAAAVERELAGRRAMTGSRTPPELVLLGEPRLRDGGVVRSLTLRHAEILVLLGAHPAGLSAAQLAVLLHEGELSEVTVRAEVSRLRRVVGDLVAGPRPYRLAGPLRTDVDLVRDLLAAGDVAGAVARHPAPLLPRSQAPGVADLREELEFELRTAVLGSRDPEALDRWTRGATGADDLAAWVALASLVDDDSPLGSRVRAHRTMLDARFR